MEKIGIITEETVDLPQDIVIKHQISIVPVILNWPELEEIPGINTFQKMRELEKRGTKSFGKTSQPSPNDFLIKYKDALKRFEKVLCITLTSKLSGSNNSATLAMKLLGPEDQQKVHVVDSLNASCGQALVVLNALDLIEEGKRLEEIVKELESSIPQVHTFVMFEDPKWLEASGRISHIVTSLIRGLNRIRIRPVLASKDGLLTPAGLKTRSQDLANTLFKQIENSIKRSRKGSNRIRVAITHADDINGANRLKDMIGKGIENVEVTSLHIINNVVGVLAGPNTLAVAWSGIRSKVDL
jgi:DegV family protein with EDD domain